MKTPTPYFSITDAEYLSGYKVKLTFLDGTVQTIDFGMFLNTHPHPQHNRFKDVKKFKKFQVRNGNIFWGKNRDLMFPEEELYAGISPS